MNSKDNSIWRITGGTIIAAKKQSEMPVKKHANTAS